MGHYSSSIMVQAIRSLHNALILFSYSILCSLTIIHKIMKYPQKYKFHPNHIVILPLFGCFILITDPMMGPPTAPQQRKGPEQNVPPLAAADSTGRGKTFQPAPSPPTVSYSLPSHDRIDDRDQEGNVNGGGRTKRMTRSESNAVQDSLYASEFFLYPLKIPPAHPSLLLNFFSFFFPIDGVLVALGAALS